MSFFYKNASGVWQKTNAHCRIATKWAEVKNFWYKTSTGWKPAWTYSWVVGSWSGCSVSCGGGTQTRTVTCRRSDGYNKADAFCADLPSKPAASQACNTQSCYDLRIWLCDRMTNEDQTMMFQFAIPWQNSPNRGYDTYNVYLNFYSGCCRYRGGFDLSTYQMYINELVNRQTLNINAIEVDYTEYRMMDGNPEPYTVTKCGGTYQDGGTLVTSGCLVWPNCGRDKCNPNVNCYKQRKYMGQYVHAAGKPFVNLSYTVNIFRNDDDHEFTMNNLSLELV